MALLREGAAAGRARSRGAAEAVRARRDGLAVEGVERFDVEDRAGAGGDIEVSVELRDMLFGRDLTRLALFNNHAQFLTATGARFSYRYMGRKYYWDLLGEAAKQRQFGFSDALDDLPRFRVRSGFGFRTESGWDFSVYSEAETWDDDDAWAFGFQAQRSF